MGPDSGSARGRVLAELAGRVPAAAGADCVLMGIDGPDGAGKTVLADELAGVLRAAARPVVRVSVDDFHHVRAARYRRGRTSPEGCWLDSFDYDRLRADVLEPLGPGGSRRYRPRAHDLATDEVLHPEPLTAPAGSVVVVDGRYVEAQRRYVADAAPATRATVVLDNTDPAAPRILPAPAS